MMKEKKINPTYHLQATSRFETTLFFKFFFFSNCVKGKFKHWDMCACDTFFFFFNIACFASTSVRQVNAGIPTLVQTLRNVPYNPLQTRAPTGLLPPPGLDS